MIWNIFHCINPTFSEDIEQERSYEGSVEAESLQDAYIKTQNLDEYGWNGDVESRSTSVGDLIQNDDTEEIFMVMDFGFKAIGHQEML